MTKENSSNNKPVGQKSPNKGRDKSAERQERTAQALRDNLRRRKVQKKTSGNKDTGGKVGQLAPQNTHE